MGTSKNDELPHRLAVDVHGSHLKPWGSFHRHFYTSLLSLYSSNCGDQNHGKSGTKMVVW